MDIGGVIPFLKIKKLHQLDSKYLCLRKNYTCFLHQRNGYFVLLAGIFVYRIVL